MATYLVSASEVTGDAPKRVRARADTAPPPPPLLVPALLLVLLVLLLPKPNPACNWFPPSTAPPAEPEASTIPAWNALHVHMATKTKSVGSDNDDGDARNGDSKRTIVCSSFLTRG